MKSVDAVKSMGFVGFESVRNLCDTRCNSVPKVRGVYLVVRNQPAPPVFLQASPAGHFKDKDPSVTVDTLRASWLDGSIVLYIGKAGGSTSGATLRKRIHQYMKFGSGQRIGHWGGRYIWQLSDAQELLVCWRPVETEEPRTVEALLIRTFESAYGKLPFANVKH